MKQWIEKDETLVCLQTDEGNMKDYQVLCVNHNIRQAEFRDSDLNDMLTAIAIGPLDKKTGDLFFSCLRLA